MEDQNTGYAFLSYSRQDEAIAQDLVTALNARGVKVWRDVDQIEPGSKWADELEQGLLKASAILYLASKNSSESKWMAYELRAFISKGRPVIPIVIDDSGVSSVPEPLRIYQWLNISAGFDKVASRIAEVLQKTGAVTDQAVAPEKQKSKGYVFLSYTEEDNDFLEILRPFLAEHRYAYWDFQESDRDYHGQFIIELEKII